LKPFSTRDDTGWPPGLAGSADAPIIAIDSGLKMISIFYSKHLAA